jgi:hypothetical protein
VKLKGNRTYASVVAFVLLGVARSQGWLEGFDVEFIDSLQVVLVGAVAYFLRAGMEE